MTMVADRSRAGLGILLLVLALGCPALDPAGAQPGDDGPGTVREIPVTIATDGAFRQEHRWRALAEQTVADATVDFEELVGLRFVVVEEATWEFSGEATSMEQLLDAAVAEVGPRPGLIAVFTGRRAPQTGQWSEMGYAYLGRPALIIALPRSRDIPFASHLERELVHYFRHELGHVFGIPHLRGPNVMTDDPMSRRPEFADIALDILRANRNLDFTAASPFSGCDLEALRDAYLFLDSRGECEPALLTNLGVAFHREQRPEEARVLFEATLRRRDDSVAARLGLAQTLLDLGDTLSTRSLMDALGDDGLTDGAALGVLGGLWVRLGDPARGRILLTEALAADSTRFAAWFNRGLASFQLEDYEPARADLERALAVEERPEGWFNLGLVGDAADDGDCVRRAFTRYLELVPEGPRAEDARRILQRWP
jgi:tetratricopeptide (TPR) repeat protein